MKSILLVVSICLSSCAQVDSKLYDRVRQMIIKTNQEIRDGFVNQDIPYILKFHHPDIEKVLSWDDYQRGHGDIEKALRSIFENYILEFQGNAGEMDSLRIFEETAVMIARFSVKGSPKREGFRPFVFSGRTMIVYLRESDSPTGWVMIREMIVPAK